MADSLGIKFSSDFFSPLAAAAPSSRQNQPSSGQSSTMSGMDTPPVSGMGGETAADTFFKQTLASQRDMASSGVASASKPDGRFSFKRAGMQFLKGLISPIAGMFSSVKNCIIGLALGAVGLAAMIAFGGTIGPLLMTVGLTLGTLQGATAVYKLITAKSNAERERAFYGLGAATIVMLLCGLGAKFSLRNAGVAAAETERMSVLQALGRNIRLSGRSAVESWRTVRSGNAWGNLRGFATSHDFKSAQGFKSAGKKSFEAAAASPPMQFQVEPGVPDHVGKVAGKLSPG